MTINSYDAAVLDALPRCDPTPEHLASMSSRWRPWGERLASLPTDERNGSLASMLATLDKTEADALEAAMSRHGLDGMPPVPSEGEAVVNPAASWGPLRIGEPPPVEPFPLDVLPQPVVDLVTEGALSIGCPCDFLAVPALAVAGGAIGRTVALRLKRGYFASSTLFVACVGPPSDGKSPALKTVADPLRKIDAVLALEYDQAMGRWKAECDRVGSDGKKAKSPAPPPRPRRIDVDDVTMEALPLILADNPRGLVMVRDELTALVMGLNQYKSGKGSDRAVLLKIWSGDAIKKDRVAHENNAPIRCPHPSLSIVGGVPPDMLGELADAKGRGDGFTDRFLFTYPNSPPVPSWSNVGVPDDVADGWSAVVERLWVRSTDDREGRPAPHVARMTPRGEAAWQRLYDVHSEEMNHPEFPPSLRGPWGKLREYAGRLALILALLDHAAVPDADASIVPDATERHVENAWRLVAYFKSHAKRVHAAVNLGVAGPEAAAAKAIVSWLQDGGRATFTEHEVKQARRWIEPDALVKALSYLAKSNAIRVQEAPQGTAKPGRPPSPVYDVNPCLLVT